MVPTDEGESWGSLGERVRVPRSTRTGRSVRRFKGGGMEVPEAEGRGTVVPGTGRGLDGDPQGAEHPRLPWDDQSEWVPGSRPLSEELSPPSPSLYSTTWTIAPCIRTTASAPETPNAVGVRGPAKLHHLLEPPLEL